MKGFVGITHNDWFAYVTLLKQDWPKAKAIKFDWAKLNREISLICEMSTSLFQKKSPHRLALS